MQLVHTQITLKSVYPSTHSKSVQLFMIAKSLGFALLSDKSPHQAVLYDGEAEDIKNELRRQGMADCDFQLFLEYQRGWGFL